MKKHIKNLPNLSKQIQRKYTKLRKQLQNLHTHKIKRVTLNRSIVTVTKCCGQYYSQHLQDTPCLYGTCVRMSMSSSKHFGSYSVTSPV